MPPSDDTDFGENMGSETPGRQPLEAGCGEPSQRNVVAVPYCGAVVEVVIMEPAAPEDAA